MAPKMNITNLFQLFVSFVQKNMWSCFIIFSMIQMTTSFKYDIIKITFSRHFCNFSIKRRVFKQFFFRKHWAITLTKCFHHICIYPRLISDKHFFSCSKRRFIFSIQNTIRKMSFFYWFNRSKTYVMSIILKDSGIMYYKKFHQLLWQDLSPRHGFKVSDNKKTWTQYISIII